MMYALSKDISYIMKPVKNSIAFLSTSIPPIAKLLQVYIFDNLISRNLQKISSSEEIYKKISYLRNI